MPNFLESIFAQLQRGADRVVLREIHGEQFVSTTGRELLDQVRGIRAYLRNAGLRTGDRCALLATSSSRWAAFDIALMAEGLIVVALYSRQSRAELAAMMRDSQPKLLLASDAALGDTTMGAWSGDPSSAPRRVLFDEVLQPHAPTQSIPDAPNSRTDYDIVTIIYTSGTSGEAKGVRRGVEDALSKRAAPIRSLFAKAREAWQRKASGHARPADALWLVLGRKLIFSKVKERFGPNVRALICGSAPLAPETQQFFLMLGIPALQAYGLTETTAICTLDDPRAPVEPGYVGQAIPGIEMKIAENEEIIVRGPHVFAGYWNRPEETARVLRDSWFHTGDQGQVNLRSNWRIIGRIKNLIILNSGHNVAPEPIEDKIAQHL